MKYIDGKPAEVTSVVISTQHSKDLNQDQVKDLVEPYIQKSIPENLLSSLKKKRFILTQQGSLLLAVQTVTLV